MFVTVAYLQTEKSGILSYRRKFPKGLTRFIPSASATGKGRVELKVALSVRSLNEPQAMDRYRAAASEYEKIVLVAERAKSSEAKRLSGTYDALDAHTTAYLAALVIGEGLSIDEEVRLLPEPSERKRRRAARLREVSVADLAECRELRGVGDVRRIIDIWGAEAASLADGESLYFDRSAPSFATLCTAINDAQITVWEGVLARLSGDLVPTPPLPPAHEGPARASPAGERVGLLDLFEQYALTPGRHPKTVAQWRPYIRHLVDFVGKDDVQAITHDQLVRWRNFLRDKHTYRGKPLSAKTINASYMVAVQALLSWAKGDGLISSNPMLEVTNVRLPAAPKTRSRGFTNEEALTILRATILPSASREGRHFRDAKRWVPWLMAYSGARVNEMTQLRKEDVSQKDGFWVMRITPEAGRVKTNEYRLVPLHSHLIDQGFAEFVDGMAAGPLFFDPAKRRSEHAINRQSNRLGSKLASWVRSLGIDGVMPNHAWRHYFATAGARYGLDHRVSKAITGHASSNVHERTYMSDLPNFVDVLSRELEKMPRFKVP